MGRDALPKTLHIGRIVVETSDIFTARQVAEMVLALPGKAEEGVMQLDKQEIKWRLFRSASQSPTYSDK